MIKNIALKFGSSPGRPDLEIETTPITVFVGPNNSGKSKLISEIWAQCSQDMSDQSSLILKKIEFQGLGDEEALRLFASMKVEPPSGVLPFPDHTFIKANGSVLQVIEHDMVRMLSRPENLSDMQNFRQFYLSSRTLMLDGRNRINLVNDQVGGDLQQPPKTSFQKLFRDDELRKTYSDIVKRCLGYHAVIDPTSLGQLRLRLSSSAPASPDLERGLGSNSVNFHAAAQHIASASDGAKAFTGILAEISAGNPNVLLMDEPEAFLHPTLAFNLGLEIAQSLRAVDKRMFVSTHSPQFLMGCIQSGVPVNVIRLTYRGGVATARLLPNNDIVKMMRNPLLRSAGVILALFYESVVVTEADPDRAFYQEINERLLRQGRGIPNCIFLNAQNKQTIPTIIAPLRNLGIPSAAIYDIDFVKDGGSVATRFMDSAYISRIAQQGLGVTRSAVSSALSGSNHFYKTKGGVDVLSEADKAAADDYFDHLDAYGAFVVRGGELESWLKALEVDGHGPSWLIPMFEKMGEDPNVEGYLLPSQDDVWMFIDRVASWLLDPGRKGIPT